MRDGRLTERGPLGAAEARTMVDMPYLNESAGVCCVGSRIDEGVQAWIALSLSNMSVVTVWDAERASN